MQGLLILGVLLAVFFIFSWLAVKSLSKLDPRFSRFYDFGAFFPKSGRWSITVYLVILAILVGLVLYFGRAEISKLVPA